MTTVSLECTKGSCWHVLRALARHVGLYFLLQVGTFDMSPLTSIIVESGLSTCVPQTQEHVHMKGSSRMASIGGPRFGDPMLSRFHVWLGMMFASQLASSAALPERGHDGLCLVVLPARAWQCSLELVKPSALWHPRLQTIATQRGRQFHVCVRVTARWGR